ncbi:MAG: DNA mismatch repair endonuclease MutL [Lachnospiraceae bacterium]|nr:DNA mismatch repair endonuclease MutL [Lachnospiraceae bacterium]
MTAIQILDSATIDKIAAGEVVERPSSVVKELVENALDACADAITVEIKEGGITFIRVTDNGSGIDSSQIRNAFMRHATSKIRSAEDLTHVVSLGFRGEALSSICAVAQVELITKTKDNLTGVRYVCEGAVEKECSEIGAPTGTTVLVKNLFFNTPVRRKFLKQPMTEGGYIIDLMEHMALSRPDTAFKLMVNGQVKFHTSGNGSLKEVIYRIYGKETASQLLPFEKETKGIKVEGYLGKPILNRSNRNFENYYINGRYIKSSLIAKALEDGYSNYLMQHKFPFTVLHFTIDTEMVDVNVHPTKMDVRFTGGNYLYDFVASSVAAALQQREMIPEALLSEEKEEETQKIKVPEPFEQQRTRQFQVMEEQRYEAVRSPSRDIFIREAAEESLKAMADNTSSDDDFFVQIPARVTDSTPTLRTEMPVEPAAPGTAMPANAEQTEQAPAVKTEPPKQLDLFDEKMLTKENRPRYRILGQIFDTYWLIAFTDKLFIVDQHAAHEKVKYERLMKHYHEKDIVTQTLNPPIVVTLSAKEEATFLSCKDVFAGLGFEIEDFGGREYALRGVPVDLYGQEEKTLFLSVLDEMSEGPLHKDLTVVEEKLATMACKSAVKGNHSFSFAEMEALIDELLTLDNPYNCPHGRPTIISMSKYEIEKKFKRIV